MKKKWNLLFLFAFIVSMITPVSYTHLDVYKRQVDEKANAETAKKVVECKKTGLIDCFIYNTISSSYMTAVLDSL